MLTGNRFATMDHEMRMDRIDEFHSDQNVQPGLSFLVKWCCEEEPKQRPVMSVVEQFCRTSDIGIPFLDDENKEAITGS